MFDNEVSGKVHTSAGLVIQGPPKHYEVDKFILLFGNSKCIKITMIFYLRRKNSTLKKPSALVTRAINTSVHAYTEDMDAVQTCLLKREKCSLQLA